MVDEIKRIFTYWELQITPRKQWREESVNYLYTYIIDKFIENLIRESTN